jgi:hypothetical protein
MFVIANADIVIPVLSNYGAGLLVRDPFGAISKVPFESFAVIIPEPPSVVLLGTSLLCIMAVCGSRRRSRRQRKGAKSAEAFLAPPREATGHGAGR